MQSLWCFFSPFRPMFHRPPTPLWGFMYPPARGLDVPCSEPLDATAWFLNSPGVESACSSARQRSWLKPGSARTLPPLLPPCRSLPLPLYCHTYCLSVQRRVPRDSAEPSYAGNGNAAKATVNGVFSPLIFILTLLSLSDACNTFL